jgi:MFS transporter, DHA2 family, multidrug resistance protein
MNPIDPAIKTPTVKATRREWLGLAVIALPCVLYAMDLTVLNLALPALSEALRPSATELLWIVDIYGFMVAGFLTTMGTLGDRIGRRRLLLIGAAAFGVASVCAAFSTSATMLIATRAVLGIAGATLAPSTLSLIRNMFLDPKQRTVAIGVWISSYSVGGAIGPLLGGALLQHFWWGSVFLLAVPVMLVLLMLGPVLLPEYREAVRRPLDLWSAVLSLLAVLPAIYGIKHIAQDGLGWPPVLCIFASIAFGMAFIRRQGKLPNPLIDLRLFRVPVFSASLATYMLGTMVAFGSYVFIGQYLQLVLGLSPLQSGLWTLPWSAGFIVGSMMASKVVRKIGPALAMGAGLALAAVGFAVLSRLADVGLGGLVVGTLVMSLGLAQVFTLATDVIVGSVPPEQAGAASALSETSSELGGALGIAILGSIGTAVYRSAMAKAGLVGLTTEARNAEATLGGAVAASKQLPAAVGLQLLEASRAAFTDALQMTVGICALMAAAAAIAVVLTLRRAGERQPVSLSTEAEGA